jgi:hypothetical protein
VRKCLPRPMPWPMVEFTRTPFVLELGPTKIFHPSVSRSLPLFTTPLISYPAPLTVLSSLPSVSSVHLLFPPIPSFPIPESRCPRNRLTAMYPRQISSPHSYSAGSQPPIWRPRLAGKRSLNRRTLSSASTTWLSVPQQRPEYRI